MDSYLKGRCFREAFAMAGAAALIATLQTQSDDDPEVTRLKQAADLPTFYERTPSSPDGEVNCLVGFPGPCLGCGA